MSSSLKIVRAKGLKWIAAGVVSVGSVLAVGLTASAKSPAAGPQVATLAPAADSERGRGPTRLVTIQRGVERGQRQSLPRRFVDHLPQPVDPLIPPVAQQLGVERADADSAVGHSVDAPGDEVAGVGGDLLQRRVAVVGIAVVAPDAVAIGGVAVVVAVGRARRIAGLAPDQGHGLTIDRPQDHSI